MDEVIVVTSMMEAWSVYALWCIIFPHMVDGNGGIDYSIKLLQKDFSQWSQSTGYQYCMQFTTFLACDPLVGCEMQ